MWPGVYLFSAASSCMQQGVLLPLGSPMWVRKQAPRTAKHGQDCYHNLRRATGRVGAGATDKIVTAIYAVDPAAPGINFDARE